MTGEFPHMVLHQLLFIKLTIIPTLLFGNCFIYIYIMLTVLHYESYNFCCKLILNVFGMSLVLSETLNYSKILKRHIRNITSQFIDNRCKNIELII